MDDFLFQNNITLVGIDGLGTEYESYITIFDLCSRELNFFKKILFTCADISPVDGIDIIKIPKLSYKDYQLFCLNGVAKHIKTDYALFIQSDGFINDGKNWTNEFLEYDYVAQPWLHDTIPNRFPWVSSPEESVGEGGFSLRSKKLLDLISSLGEEQLKQYVNSGANEDIVISVILRKYLKQSGCKICPPDLGKKFCAGINNFNLSKLDTSFGFHAVEYIKPVLEKYKQKYNLNLDDMINYKEKL